MLKINFFFRFLFLPLLLLLIASSFGYSPAEARDQVILKIGIYENPPKIFISESGKPAGIFVDIIEHIAHREGWKLQYVFGTWGCCIFHPIS